MMVSEARIGHSSGMLLQEVLPIIEEEGESSTINTSMASTVLIRQGNQVEPPAGRDPRSADFGSEGQNWNSNKRVSSLDGSTLRVPQNNRTNSTRANKQEIPLTNSATAAAAADAVSDHFSYAVNTIKDMTSEFVQAENEGTFMDRSNINRVLGAPTHHHRGISRVDHPKVQSSLVHEEKKEPEDAHTVGGSHRSSPKKGEVSSSGALLPSTSRESQNTAITESTSYSSQDSDVTTKSVSFAAPIALVSPAAIMVAEGMSPMMRMRNLEAQQAVAMTSDSDHRAHRSGGRQHLTEEQVKADKQKKWKRKMKLAQMRQREELDQLEQDAHKGRYDTSLSGNENASLASEGGMLPNPCTRPMTFENLWSTFRGPASSDRQSRQQRRSKRSQPTAVSVLQQMMRTRCGELEEVDSHYDESDEDSFEEGSYSDSEDDDDDDYDDDNRHRSRRGGRRSDSHEPPNFQRRGRESKVAPEDTRYRSSHEEKGGVLDVQDKNFIQLFIHQASKVGYSFLWHNPGQSNKAAPVRASTITMFLKVTATDTARAASHFNSIQLVWNSFHENRIDLFDIAAVETATSALQLKAFPFAMPIRCVLIRVHRGGSLVLEARSEDEAATFVHGMKWMIARLSFNLIIGNAEASCELLGEDHDKGTSKSQSENVRRNIIMDDIASHMADKITHSIAEKRSTKRP